MSELKMKIYEFQKVLVMYDSFARACDSVAGDVMRSVRLDVLHACLPQPACVTEIWLKDQVWDSGRIIMKALPDVFTCCACIAG